MKCPKCQIENPEGNLYCSRCATPLKPSKENDFTQAETVQVIRKELTVGSTFAGRYQVIEDLGEGGMGKVYKVLDNEINEKVALKLLKPEIATDKRTIERFRNELKLARKITHKNVCRMHDLNHEEETYYITMEYVAGEDLKSFIKRIGQLPIGKAISIAKQVSDGLQEAHRLGIVHRDLKPQNIMVDEDGNARIMDFGIARSLQAKGVTEEGVIIGTPEYMSPEQVEGKGIGRRSDIYSLGVILYEMVTGKVPFEGDTPLSIAMKHKSETPEDPLELNAQIPRELSQIILKCLEKDKEKRFHKANEVISELEGTEEIISAKEKAISKRKPTISKVITPLFWKKRLVIPTLIICCLAIAAIIFWPLIPKHEVSPISQISPSIVVLPFSDLSPQKDQEYFCDGMTEEIIAKLSRFEGWRVISRTSAMTYKNTIKGIKEIGQELNVATVLEGSIRKEQDDIRINVSLISVEDSSHLWSDNYNRQFERVFDVQNDIAENIAKALKRELSSEEQEQLQKKPTDNLEAYNLYLQGRYFWNKRSKEGMKKSIKYFQQALEKDQDYALAYAGLADCYSTGGGSYLDLSTEVAYARAKDAALKALAIDETLAEAHTSLASAEELVGNWHDAEREFKRAIELNPSYALAYMWYAETLWGMGRLEEAIVQVKYALELDPLSLIVNTAVGAAYYFAGKYDEAIEQLRYTLELDADFYRAKYWLGLAYAKNGKLEEAIEEFQNVLKMSGGNPEYLAALGYAHALAGNRSESIKILSKLKEQSRHRFVSPYGIAMIYVAMNEKTEAFSYLEKALEVHDDDAGALKVDPAFESLRSDPRFQKLIDRLFNEEDPVQQQN